ncbi:MAG: hypothetical protein J6O61_04965 [Butyrivibrio sp.]|uniref:hypothetical protein n=1 Tax=Butyrivibrio sp. TaxID=28121 RepID=UPI001B0BEB5D|nr:hypothetical protein [Butyrivibrio sp.]MBO6240178.1 hypothetical protein [Butyrivibrio sp.]
MLHIIILNKNYFPAKLSAIKPNDKVIVLASPDGAIPVSAYKDEALKNMEVRLLPEIKDSASQDGKAALRIAQAMIIGQLTSGIKDFSIYTDDAVLLKALTPFTGVKKASAKKAAVTKTEKVKEEPKKDAAPLDNEEEPKAEVSKKAEKKSTEKKSAPKETNVIKKEKAKAKASEAKKESKPSKVTKADVKTKPAKLPTQAEVKRVIGASNSGYSKAIMEVIKKSNQITFEMDLRMKLVEAGMDPNQCKELAHSINEEFGKTLPTS